LVASVSDVLSRYKLTRHLHPLQAEGYTLIKAIDTDVSLVEVIRSNVDILIDTTGFKIDVFKQKIFTIFRGDPQKLLTLSLVSFGFKHGIPLDADTVFDIRLLQNPFYEDDLRSLTGLDIPVIDYVKAQPLFQAFFDQFYAAASLTLQTLLSQKRTYYELAVGCTGGRHRSVVMVESLAHFIKQDGRFDVFVHHRDLSKLLLDE
jgi:UPF0042 nucleotide-binding protein